MIMQAVLGPCEPLRQRLMCNERLGTLYCLTLIGAPRPAASYGCKVSRKVAAIHIMPAGGSIKLCLSDGSSDRRNSL